MDICFIIPSMCGGGAERVVNRLSNEFVSVGHSVTIMLTSEVTIEYELNEKVDTVLVGGKTGGSFVKRMDRLSAIRKYYKQHPQTHYIAMESSTNMFALIAAIGLKIDIIVSERIDPSVYEARLFRDMVYYTLGRRFVFQTSYARDYFGRRICKRSYVIPNPTDPNLPSAYVGARKRVIVAVGRLEKQKDYPTLISAFSKFVNEYSDYELHIYGKGSLYEDLRDSIVTEGLADKVKLMGFSTDIWEKERKSRMYILSSLYEGMPNALIEAMSVGMPVIATDSAGGGARELVENGKNGLLIEVGNIEIMADSMKKLASDDDLCEIFSKEAVLIREELSISKIADVWMEMLDKYDRS